MEGENKQSLLVGLSGGSGSGKTSLVKALAQCMESSLISFVTQDNYYLPVEQQQKDQNGRVNFDLPGAIDSTRLQADLRKLLNGETIFVEEYGFNNKTHEPKVVWVKPAPIVIVEGLFVLHFDAEWKLLNKRIYIDVVDTVRAQRRLNRDRAERGLTEEAIRYQWENHVQPADVQFLHPYRNNCDLLLDNSASLDVALSTLQKAILAIHK